MAMTLPKSWNSCAAFAEAPLAVGINMKKGGTDPPLVAYEDLPKWATELLEEPQQTLYELNQRLKAEGEEAFAEAPEASLIAGHPSKLDISRFQAKVKSYSLSAMEGNTLRPAITLICTF